ncbi:hypothetical protein D3C77_451070 [compost metagenome]
MILISPCAASPLAIISSMNSILSSSEIKSREIKISVTIPFVNEGTRSHSILASARSVFLRLANTSGTPNSNAVA